MKKNVEDSDKMKECTKAFSKNKIYQEDLRRSSFNLDLVLVALPWYCGDNRHKIRTSFKTLLSKNARTWRLQKTSR